jgi:cobalt-zinc-cadmium efflux system membrane fusion protein
LEDQTVVARKETIVKGIAVLVGLAVLGMVLVSVTAWSQKHSFAISAAAEVGDVPTGPAVFELATDQPDSIRLTEAGIAALKISTTKVQHAPPPEPLRLPGSLLLDPSRLVRVHARFPGELAQIGTITEAGTGSDVRNTAAKRPLRYGDRVLKGQMLAVVWSKDIGEKKSELIDAISKLGVDRSQLSRYEQVEKGVVPERLILDARRNVEADLIAEEKALRTLISWRVSPEEIEAVRKEAREIQSRTPHGDKNVARTWAETEVRAPISGTIVEKNYNVGDIIDNTQDIFKVADLSRIQVVANVYEEDLPALRALRPEQRHWKIDIKSDPNDVPIPGNWDLIGNIIDPTQHAGAIMGWLDNFEGKLSVGQFITATIELLPDPELVAIPTSAVVEEGDTSSVFIESKHYPHTFTRRRVAVVRRGRTLVHVRAVPSDLERAAGAQPLKADESVVDSGVLELASELDNLKSAALAK